MIDENSQITSKSKTYEIVRKLGEGYTGEVFLVKESDSEDALALKLLNPAAFKEGQLEAFKREFSILSDLHHPHLCKVYDFGYAENKDRYFFTSELIQGNNLYEFTDKLSLEEIEEIFIQIVDAIGFIHTAGLIHFDIKGANILITIVDNKPLVKIVDFGLAAPSVEVHENIVGTVRYISPEMITKNEEVDYRADLYSLGIVLYRMLAKEYPDQGSTMEEVLAWHSKHTTIGIEHLITKGVPAYLIDVIEKLTSPIPSERFSSASVIVKYIEIHSGHSYKTTQRKLLTTLTEEGPLVGRNSIMENIRSKLSILSENKTFQEDNNTLILTGPVGIGKSRLIEETKYIGQLNDLNTLILDCKNNGNTISALKKILNIPESENNPDFVSRIMDMQPVCLLIDDIDKAGPQIKEIFTGLANYLYSTQFMGSKLAIYLIMTMTTSSSKEALPIPLHLGIDIERLKPLSQEEIAQYLRQFLGETEPPENQIKDIYSFSGGIPELIRIAIASLDSPTGRVKKDTKRMFFDMFATLSESSKQLLGYLTLSRKSLSNEELISLSESIIEPSLNELAKAGLIKFDRFSDTYNLATGAIKSAASSFFNNTQKVDFSKKLFDQALESDPEDIDSLIMYAENIDDPEKLSKFLIKGADKKSSIGEVEQAYSYYEKVLSKLDSTDSRVSEIHRKLGKNGILIGKLDEAKRHIDEAITSTTVSYQDLIGLSWISRLRRSPKDALKYIQEALNLPNIKENEIDYLKLLNEKAECYLQMGETGEAENIFRDTSERANKLPDDKKLLIANNNLGRALARDGKFNDAIEFYKNKYETFSKDKRLASSILSNLGFTYQQNNQADEAYETYKQSLELSAKIGDIHNASIILGNIICLCQSKALFSDALKFAQESLKLTTRVASEKDLATNFLTIGSLHIALGLDDVAEKYLKEAINIVNKFDDKLMEAWIQFSFSFLYKNRGRAKEALAYLKNAYKLATIYENKELFNLICHATADIYIDSKKFDEAKEYIDKIDIKWPGAGDANETEMKIEHLRCKYFVYSNDEIDVEVLRHMKELAKVSLKQGLKDLASEAYHLLGVYYERLHDDETSIKYIAKAKEIIDDIAQNLSEEYRDSFLKQRFRHTVSEDSLRLSRSIKIEDSMLKSSIKKDATKAQETEVGKTAAFEYSSPTIATNGIFAESNLNLIGQSESINRIQSIIAKMKDSHSHVLIIGENGVGKKLIAELIQKKGSFRNLAFKNIDFAEFPEEFLIDEIFGREKEALLEAAENGILLLNNIQDMPSSIQKELLKALKRGRYNRLRDNAEVQLKVRFIATSEMAINELVKKTKFNKDLLKQLAFVPIEVPPLRKRTEDIPILINYFLKKIAHKNNELKPYQLSTEALKALIHHSWNNNVRELEQVLQSACLLSATGELSKEEIEVHLG